MGIYEENLAANQQYAEKFTLGHLPMPPARKLAIVACMDARLTVEQFLGLKTGDAHIIRNAGGLVTEDAIRSLIISTYLLGTRTYYVVQHTDCGMLTFTDEKLREQLKTETGHDASHLHFHSFSDVEKSVKKQLQAIRSNPFLPRDIDVHGFVYDVRSGKLHEISEAAEEARAASLSS
ncbi:MAG TPA: carbonic anhydrase [Candidatus Acidoferrum sp.]|nr:carbonic anhydrase [Candidatus Acidoferrum sp.]